MKRYKLLGIGWILALVVVVSLYACGGDDGGGGGGGDAPLPTAPQCSDGIDNNWDGLIDLNDIHCTSAGDTLEGAHILKVDASAPVGGDGKSWATAYKHPQTAVNAAELGDMVWVKSGTYYRPSATGTGPVLTMRNYIDIYGGFAGTENSLNERSNDWAVLSRLDGENASNHVVVGASYATLNGFRVINGNSSGAGGGMYNKAVKGLIVRHCFFTSNKAVNMGAGMYNYDHSSPQIINVVFNNNQATSATSYGGGMANSLSSSPQITNCIFVGNEVNWGGGAIHNEFSSSPKITNCTIGHNTSGHFAGGIFVWDNSNPVLINTILWGDYADFYPSGAVGTELYTEASCSVTYYRSDIRYISANAQNLNLDPKFVSASNLNLNAGSPCIDAGTYFNAPNFDLYDNVRPQGLDYDIGAIEY